MKVLFLPEVQQYYDNLEQILYEKGYFSFPDSSKKYVKELVNDIKANLPVKLKKKAPEYFTDRYGEGLYYAIFPKNKRTQWYVFFRMYEKGGELYYQVRYIGNNHVIAQYL